MHLWSRLDYLVTLNLTPNHERVHRPLDVVRSRLLALGENCFRKDLQADDFTPKMYDGQSHQNSRSVSTCVASVYGVGELMSTVRLGNMSASIFDLKEDDSLSLSKILCFAKVKISVGQVLTDR